MPSKQVERQGPVLRTQKRNMTAACTKSMSRIIHRLSVAIVSCLEEGHHLSWSKARKLRGQLWKVTSKMPSTEIIKYAFAAFIVSLLYAPKIRNRSG